MVMMCGDVDDDDDKRGRIVVTIGDDDAQEVVRLTPAYAPIRRLLEDLSFSLQEAYKCPLLLLLPIADDGIDAAFYV